MIVARSCREEAHQRANMSTLVSLPPHSCNARPLCAIQRQAGEHAQLQKQIASRVTPSRQPVAEVVTSRCCTQRLKSAKSHTWPSRPTSWGCLPAPRRGATTTSAEGVGV